MYGRPVRLKERQQLEAGLRSSEAFTLRRCQSLLVRARGQCPAQIARPLGSASPSVRHAIDAFHTRGLASLKPHSCWPRRTRVVIEGGNAEPWRTLLHERLRALGTPRSLWTLRLATEVCWEHGRTPYPVRIETICQALKGLGGAGGGPSVGAPAPIPPMPSKKTRDRLSRLAAQPGAWGLGFVDESWWSHVAPPTLHSWTAEPPLQLIEQDIPTADQDPKALACYGLLRTDANTVWRRFVDGRPMSHVTTALLPWVCALLAQTSTSECWCWSGTMLLGTSAERGGPGGGSLISGRSRPVEAAS